MPKKKTYTFHESITRLEEIVTAMEQPTISLEQSVQLYKEGVQLSVDCGQSLQHIEEEVLVLKKMADDVFLLDVLQESGEAADGVYE